MRSCVHTSNDGASDASKCHYDAWNRAYGLCLARQGREIYFGMAFDGAFIVCRGFLVNIHFITQVSGNSAGMKASLFSCDKVIPVSRSNISEFKERFSGKTTLAHLKC